MLFYKLSAELNGLPHCSIANDDNKSYMHILSLLSSLLLVIFWAKIEYQKESKILSTHKASGFKASIRNMETVKLVFVLLSSNTAPVSQNGRMVEERSELILPWRGTGRSYQPQPFLHRCDYQTLHFPSIMPLNGFWKPPKPFIPTKSHGNKLHSSVMHNVEIMLLLSFQPAVRFRCSQAPLLWKAVNNHPSALLLHSQPYNCLLQHCPTTALPGGTVLVTSDRWQELQAGSALESLRRQSLAHV